MSEQPPSYPGPTPPPPPPPPPGPPGQIPPGQIPPGQVPPGQPGYYYAPAPRNNQKAVWSLVCGAGSLVAYVMCCYFAPLVSLPAGIVGALLAPRAKREIAASGGAQTGEGLATAGMITGIIGAVLSVLVFLAIAAFIVWGIATDGEFNGDWTNPSGL